MSTSAVAICQRALHKMGAGSITSLNDNNEKARVLKVAYDPVRKAELRRRRWKFAIKRAALPELADTPISGYDHQYQLPNDWLRLVEGGDLISVADTSDYRTSPNALYAIEGRAILTDLSAPLQIRYLADITDANLFDACFCESLAARLAFECVERITESTQKKADLFNDYRNSIREAVHANALEAPPEFPGDGEWVTARAG